MEKILIANRIQTPDGTILHSKHRHDYVCHVDKVNGERYCLDGGNDYCKISFEKNPPINCSVYSTDDFEIVRQVMLRGTYGKDGIEDFKFVPLCEMSNEWISNTINYISKNKSFDQNLQKIYISLYNKELEYRFKEKVQYLLNAKLQSDNNTEK